MGAARKIGLLMWKNLLLRKQHWFVTSVEIILPTLLILQLAYSLRNVPKVPPASGPPPRPESAKVFAEWNSTSGELTMQCADADSPCVVAFVPNSTDAWELVTMLKNTSTDKIEWRGFSSEAEIEKHVASLGLNRVRTDRPGRDGNETVIDQGGGLKGTLRAAIVFESGFGARGVFGYKIRMMPKGVGEFPLFSSDLMESLYPSPSSFRGGGGPDQGGPYADSGFTAFQFHVERALIKKFTGKDPMPFSIQRFPNLPFKGNGEFFNLIYLYSLPPMIVFGFIFIVPSAMRGVANERETGIKELMKMCGIPNWMHWLAWTLNSIMLLVFSVTIVVFLLFINMGGEQGGPMLSNSDPSIWWITLFLYALSSTVFCFFIVSFLQKPAAAITVGIILWLVTFCAPAIPMMVNINYYLLLSLSEKMLLALMPNMGLFLALKIMTEFEGKGIGAQWNNLFSQLSTIDSLTLAHIWLMFLVDTILYFLLTLYMEAVLSSPYGSRNPWYFLCQPSFWIRRDEQALQKTHSERTDEAERPGFEREPEGLVAGVVVENLTKQFGRGKVAVDGVSLKMFDGEIFALLGHNGAGKTTTISCCIGMTSASAGTIIINGKNARTDLESVRGSLGLCPQHNLLFDELTVDQHLTFFGRLKGIDSKAAKKERVEMLQKLQLLDKANTVARNLSGGQKRKLSLGISLIGKAKVVFLDEPTSGMDVQARRAIWDLLLGERGHRTIVLTTHFMEEADVLGDRIGIMAHGKLQCCGTPLFLKKYYGAGYTLTFTMSDAAKPEQKDVVLKTVQNHIPTAALKTDASDKDKNEFYIILPKEDASTSVFPAMFKELHGKKDSLGIRTIGMSVTTMDEVFIKADEGASPEQTKDNVQPIPIPPLEDVRASEPSVVNVENGPPSEMQKSALNVPDDQNGQMSEMHEGPRSGQIPDRARGFPLYLQQFGGLLMKRIMYSVRKWKMILGLALLPILILVTAILICNNILRPTSPPKALKMDLNSYVRPVAVYSSFNESLGLGSSYASLVQPFGVKVDIDIVQELIQRGVKDLASYRERDIVAAELSSTHAKALFSTIPFHTSPLSLNLVTNAVLRSSPGGDGRKIDVTNHPFFPSSEGVTVALLIDPRSGLVITGVTFVFASLGTIGLALLAASYVIGPIEERMCNAKQLQFMTGVSPILYWGAFFLWDFILITAVILGMVLCFPLFQLGQTYTSFGGAGVILLILLAFGFAVIPFSYLWSLIAKTTSGGFIIVALLHIGSVLIGLIFSLVSVLFFQKVGDTFTILSRIFPTYSGMLCLMKFVVIAVVNSRCSRLPDNAEELLCDPKVQLHPLFRQCCSNCKSFRGAPCFKPVPYFVWRSVPAGTGRNMRGPGGQPEQSTLGLGQEIFYLILLGIAFHVLLLTVELVKQRVVIPKKNTRASQQQEDEDVQMESERVDQLVRERRVNEDALVVENLCKNYGPFAAVAHLNFGVHHGECFGLLGVNGAGKTTTFRMLTGDESRTSGNAFASGCTLEKSRKEFFAKTGYCPQFDGIIPCLTGLEMVQLFARLRGVRNVKKESEEWLGRVGLLDSKNVPCGKYSGGMKRRLSAAMAMVGDPVIVFLDEPTSGVDPVSRREFWKVITYIRDSGRAIVLTSHSMDEIAACCSRVGIMVNGQLQCIGSAQHLQNKFAQGYTISVTLKSSPGGEAETEEIFNTLEKEIIAGFSPCTLKDRHQTAMEFHVHDTTTPWDVLFGRMEYYKTRFPAVIEDYSISETTLEEVFLAFARKQYPSRIQEGGGGCCGCCGESKQSQQRQQPLPYPVPGPSVTNLGPGPSATATNAATNPGPSATNPGPGPDPADANPVSARSSAAV